MDMLNQLVAQLETEFPKFKLVAKRDSTFMKFLNICLKVITFWRMKTFMNLYTTTVGYTVYTPSSWGALGEEARFIILQHERVHMLQRKSKGSFWFSLSYLLLPLPCVWAYCRMKYEMEAYETNIHSRWLFYGASAFTEEAREEMIKRFTGPAYFWTWPWRKRIERWYDGVVERHISL